MEYIQGICHESSGVYLQRIAINYLGWLPDLEATSNAIFHSNSMRTQIELLNV